MILSERDCLSCRGDAALSSSQCEPFLAEVKSWEIVQGVLTKSYKFKNFRGAMNFATAVGELADKVDHHPDLHISWGQLKIEIYTHTVKGLTEADFVLAAKIDLLTA
ncbi:4a-hydroxytetrahydrobiopterin dehydratase [soil metagenome]